MGSDTHNLPTATLPDQREASFPGEDVIVCKGRNCAIWFKGVFGVVSEHADLLSHVIG